jgi:hypothetical protein
MTKLLTFCKVAMYALDNVICAAFVSYGLVFFYLLVFPERKFVGSWLVNLDEADPKKGEKGVLLCWVCESNCYKFESEAISVGGFFRYFEHRRKTEEKERRKAEKKLWLEDGHIWKQVPKHILKQGIVETEKKNMKEFRLVLA